MRSTAVESSSNHKKLLCKIVNLIILFILIFVVSLVFFLKNNQIITFNYLVANQEIPLSFLMLISLGIGALLGVLAWLPKILSLKQRVSRLEKQIKLSEKELNNLRVMPMQDKI